MDYNGKMKTVKIYLEVKMKQMHCPRCGKTVDTKVKEYIIDMSEGKSEDDLLKIREYYCVECNYCITAEEFGTEENKEQTKKD